MEQTLKAFECWSNVLSIKEIRINAYSEKEAKKLFIKEFGFSPIMIKGPFEFKEYQ